MSNELEDFLRRAAQRRAEHAAARAQQPQAARRPQYTDRNRERVATTSDSDDDPIVADLVPSSSDEPQRSGNRSGRSSSGRREPIHLDEPVALDQPVRLGESVRLDEASAGRLRDRSAGPSHQQGQLQTGTGSPIPGGIQPVAKETVPLSSPVTQVLLRLMTDPQGIDQAILAREILDRPTHRW